jgi:Ca2+-binding RTX toxin-like protein
MLDVRRLSLVKLISVAAALLFVSVVSLSGNLPPLHGGIGNFLERKLEYFSGQQARTGQLHASSKLAERSGGVMATINVANAAQLSAALSSANAGDTILLAAGNYGDFSISNLSFTSHVTIESADAANPAIFRSLSISGSRGLTFENLDVHFTPTSTTVAWDNAVLVKNSSDLVFAHNEITGGDAVNGVAPTATSLNSTGNILGWPCGRAMTITGSSNIQVLDNDMSTFERGMVLSDVAGLTISGNDIHDTRKSPIGGGDVSNTVISGNYLHDVNPWEWGQTYGDHADFIHIWTVPTSQTGASDGLVITGNFISQGQGTAILGIYLDDNSNGLGFTHTEIDGNVIYNGNLQGIRIENTSGAVDGNVLLQSSGELKVGPYILVRDGSTASITHNVLSSTDLEGLTGDSRGNILVQSIDSSLPNFSGNLEGDMLTWAEAMQIRQHFTGETYTLTSTLAWGDAGLVTNITDGGTTGGSIDGGTTSDPTQVPSSDGSSYDVLIDGTNAADQLSATGNGIVWVHGLGGNDVIIGNAGNHSLFGDAGNDTYVVSDTATKVVELAGQGTDTVQSSIDYTLPDNVENLVLQSGSHVGTGNALDNVITGNNDGNTLSGLGGNDTLNAGSGDDKLYGGDGNDTLIGGAGNDVMYGGAGNDTFVYSNADLGSRRVSYVDTIMDFAIGDKIDLSSIDAATKGRGNNAFTFIGDADFTGTAGQLHYYTDGSHTYICGDRNGDRVADFTICLDGLHTLHASDFVL